MSGFKADSGDRRMDRALQHVVRPWFPINQEVLTTVRKNIESGLYAKEPEKLLADLKTDFALFTFIVKELGHRGLAEKLSPKILNNPVELIRWGGVTRIAEIIAPDKNLPTTHSLTWSEPFQVARLRETAVIASTASILSEQKNLDPEVGFSRGVIREIGLNLIAWNYPMLYSKVLSNLGPDSSLDEELSKELGFTPSLLAMRVLRPANPETTDAPAETTSEDEWKMYDELCEVGAALARAEHPETYPSAQNDWQLANKYITENAGVGALELIKERAVEQSKKYQAALPDVFAPLEDFNPQRNIDVHTRMLAVTADKDFACCPPPVQEALRSLYSSIDGYAVNKAAIQTLLKTIVPQAGFTGGCVFVIDPSTASLKPRTIIGNVNLRSVSNVALEPGDLAVAALTRPDPLVDVPQTVGEEQIEGIYSVIGEQRKVGVLYLETPKSEDVSIEEKTLATYNILRKALCDVLHIK